jgi:myo-inositol-1(or 4)-monophosphatase
VLNILKAAAKSSGKIINGYFSIAKRIDTREKTSQRDLITKIDEESQEEIRKTIIKLVKEKGITEKEIGFIGEEKLNEDGKHMFIIDPIDGTTDFACGLPFFCVSIAYAFEGEIITGVVYNPNDKAMYVAERGKGSVVIRNGVTRQLKMVSTQLKDCFGSVHTNTPEAWDRAKRLNEKIRGIRDLGSIALETAMMAEGIFNMIYCSRCYVWDLAAVSLIVSEAGGMIVDLNGQEWKPDLVNSTKQLEVIGAHRENIREYLSELLG